MPPGREAAANSIQMRMAVRPERRIEGAPDVRRVYPLAVEIPGEPVQVSVPRLVGMTFTRVVPLLPHPRPEAVGMLAVPAPALPGHVYRRVEEHLRVEDHVLAARAIVALERPDLVHHLAPNEDAAHARIRLFVLEVADEQSGR